MQGSTSPSKNGRSSYSQRQFAATAAVMSRATSEVGSSPSAYSSSITGNVDVQGWLPSAGGMPRPGKQAPPIHWPSGSRAASNAAPHPSPATRSRSAATSSSGAPVRSRSTCHRIAGSESSSQAVTESGVRPAVVVGLVCWVMRSTLGHIPDGLSPEYSSSAHDCVVGDQVPAALAGEEEPAYLAIRGPIVAGVGQGHVHGPVACRCRVADRDPGDGGPEPLVAAVAADLVLEAG